eukprot:CAMPEP_0197293372 /NCGR_PEP_ID=MMETSP0890-20130614/28135_1 /TAXON_ID=44058 ORGANISM="Aureoumbra lagunensis, Strain CCMP1510" /NCGR_SAMPLE_ID=MMETSP0890 /ASSEMBLY_ACC=CAM_ASM_000533 /LENGTH=75 /DNA_ID=CAMNT_0042768051 /DNA_START=6 /DNA_END=233 /DNA_ORIENTATION=+
MDRLDAVEARLREDSAIAAAQAEELRRIELCINALMLRLAELAADEEAQYEDYKEDEDKEEEEVDDKMKERMYCT